MALRNIAWPGKPWQDIKIEDLPQDIQEWYKGEHLLLCAKLTTDGRIVLYFEDQSFDDNTEVWQTLEKKWVHVGPRKRR